MGDIDTSTIQFLLNGKLETVRDIEPTRSVLSYLRYDKRLVGSKEGCAEGDCGACTVVVGELAGEDLDLRAVNACIQFMPTLHGKALYTVEYLRQQSGDLHPVQQAMVDCHGSQCGFCTPGFIMSLWNVYVEYREKGAVASDRQLRTALSGNLCRCTGYKPILEAGKKMFDLPGVDFERQSVIGQLKALQAQGAFEYRFGKAEFHAPKTVSQLTALRHDLPGATILAGCTDIGLWVNKQFRDPDKIIYLGNVTELKQIQVEDEQLCIGAGASLEDAFNAIATYYPQIREQWERFASVPIRNAGTLGGNIANGSPIGDSMPWLITLSASVRLASRDGVRTIPLEALYVDYMKKSMSQAEVVEAVIVPVSQPGLQFRTYKLSKRYDSDISAVCAAFAIKLTENRIDEARIAFGGMAAIPKRASHTEAAMSGEVWDDETVSKAIGQISSDFSPMTDMRASSGYRLQSAENLLYRFYLETRPEMPLSANQLNVFESA